MTASSSARTGLVLNQLSRRVGQQTLLQDLNLEVAPGEILALLGPSGCGKSTTLRCIAGLDQVSSGRIELAGETPLQRSCELQYQHRHQHKLYQRQHRLPHYESLLLVQNQC